MIEPLNDNTTAFHTFLLAYWNQMACETYASFSEALSDFRSTEGDQSYKRLIDELGTLHAAGRFLPIARVQSAYRNPFWKGYGRIIVLEDLEASGISSGNDS